VRALLTASVRCRARITERPQLLGFGERLWRVACEPVNFQPAQLCQVVPLRPSEPPWSASNVPLLVHVPSSDRLPPTDSIVPSLVQFRLAAVGSARGCVLQGELVPFGIRQSEGLEKRCQFGHSYEVTGAACIHGYTSDADPPHVVEELDNLFPPIQKIGFPTKDREIIGLNEAFRQALVGKQRGGFVLASLDYESIKQFSRAGRLTKDGPRPATLKGNVVFHAPILRGKLQ